MSSPRSARPPSGTSLTLAEARVVRLVAEGLSDEDVAERLSMGLADVTVALAEVVRKLGLRSRTELALLAPGGPRDGNGGLQEERREP